MPKDKLKIEQPNASGEKIVFGISGALDFYRLAYFVEKSTNNTLEKGCITSIKEHASVNFYKAQTDDTNMYFIKNQIDGNLFFNKAKLADYIIIAVGQNSQSAMGKLKKELTSIDAVQSIFAIDEKYSSKTKLKYFD